ncbi:glycosyltransferase family 4 protein [Halorhabdus sp. SVX81]|uniref:glycosyltransferase family 4 protein n=1 Tax=Halorhabdus sp. SVX81 TaxID=2978283 RepID=UPI0023DA343D|nr:glycosyltransferase family 4 protein [Halorhabdus sp. SVX81]
MASVLALFHRSTLNPRLELFAQALVDDGHNVEALCWRRGGASNAEGDVVPTTRINTPNFPMSLWNVFFIPILYCKFVVAIYRRQPDVLLCGHISLLPLAVLLGLLTRTPVVYDVVETYETGYRSRDSVLAGPFTTLVTGIERLCLRGVAGITVIDTAEGLLAERYRGFTDNMDVVYNLPRVKPAPEQEGTDGPTTIVYAGLVDERKGIPTLLEAFSDIHPDHNIELLVVGGAVDDTLERLQERASELGVSDDVEFVGQVPYDEVHDHLLRGDIAVAPYQRLEVYEISRWNTRKIPDYMNAGLPVVAPNFGGFPEIIEETGCGITVDTGDVEAVADGIESLLADPDRARELGQHGRRALEEQYNWEREQTKVLDVFNRVRG